MKEKLLEIGETADVLDSLTMILMTCAEKDDLPAAAYVETLGLVNTLICGIRDTVREATA